MPARDESCWASWWISRFAACAICSSWPSAGSSALTWPRFSKAPAAIREATSPACAPPMPSATANSGDRAK
jgi:hypothetical protein